MEDLIERIKEYENSYSYKLTKRLPVVIRLSLRNVSKLTRGLSKPYCPVLMEIMIKTMCELCKQIDGAVIAYHQHDEIIIIVKNNQTLETDPWLGNDLQKIVSISASTATYEFNEFLFGDEEPLNLNGKPMFESRVFLVPSYSEAINILIERQKKCLNYAIGSATLFELSEKYGYEKASKIVRDSNIRERLDLLMTERNIEFDKYYNPSFRLGVLCYQEVKADKLKWFADSDPPIFPNKDAQVFLREIISG